MGRSRGFSRSSVLGKQLVYKRTIIERCKKIEINFSVKYAESSFVINLFNALLHFALCFITFLRILKQYKDAGVAKVLPGRILGMSS